MALPARGFLPLIRLGRGWFRTGPSRRLTCCWMVFSELWVSVGHKLGIGIFAIGGCTEVRDVDKCATMHRTAFPLPWSSKMFSHEVSMAELLRHWSQGRGGVEQLIKPQEIQITCFWSNKGIASFVACKTGLLFHQMGKSFRDPQSLRKRNSGHTSRKISPEKC